MRDKSTHPINIKGHGRLRHPIDQNTLIHYFSLCLLPLLLSLNPSPSNPFLLFFLRLRDVLKRFRWHADPRTTLRALALTGSLPGERSSDFAVLHRRTGLIGHPYRSDRSEHRRCNCAIAHRAIKCIRPPCCPRAARDNLKVGRRRRNRRGL